jgi:hypothetical protein
VRRLRCRQVTTQWLVGRVFKTHTSEGERWQWALTGDTVMPVCPSLGFAATRDEAKRDLAATWRLWLAMHGKDDETHRPFYGRPVDLGGGETLFLTPWNGAEPDPAPRHTDRRQRSMHRWSRPCR